MITIVPDTFISIEQESLYMQEKYWNDSEVVTFLQMLHGKLIFQTLTIDKYERMHICRIVLWQLTQVKLECMDNALLCMWLQH